MQLITILLLGAVSVTEGGESKELFADPAKAVMARRAATTELHRDAENLRNLLQSNASSEEKREAMEAFQTKREASRAEMLPGIPEQTAEEKAAARQRMKESIRYLPEERRKVMEERLAIVEEMDKLRSEEKRLSPEERQKRMQALMDRHRQIIETQMAAIEAAAALESRDGIKTTKSPFQQTLEAEKKKLNAALAGSDPAMRLAAMKTFREVTEKARQSRRQEMEQLLKPVAPPRPEPRPSLP